MAKLILSLSTPQNEVLDDLDEMQFGLMVKEKNEELARVFLDKGSDYQAIGQVFKRLMTKEGINTALVKDGSIVVYTLHKIEPNLVARCHVLTVLAAWSDPRGTDVGTVRSLILDHFLPVYSKVIDSSDIHRPPGKRMWYKLVEESLARKYYVYTLTVDKQWIQIKELDQLSSIDDKVWGDQEEYKQARVYISLKELKS